MPWVAWWGSLPVSFARNEGHFEGHFEVGLDSLPVSQFCLNRERVKVREKDERCQSNQKLNRIQKLDHQRREYKKPYDWCQLKYHHGEDTFIGCRAREFETYLCCAWSGRSWSDGDEG